MNKVIVPQYIQAFIKLMFFSAGIHLVILAIYFLQTGDSAPLNFFRIIGLDLFYPDFVASKTSGYVSVITTVGIYLCMYFFFAKQKTNK